MGKAVGKLIAAVLMLAAAVVAIPNILMLATQTGNIKTFDDLTSQVAYLQEDLPVDGQPATNSVVSPYDCIVVLGAAVRPDGTPSPILQDRIDCAIELYNANVAPKIIMSGDDQSDTSYDEVTNMKAYAVSQGVPSYDIFCDHAGLCTYDTAYRLHYVFDAKSAVMVTQRYHLYRALFDAHSFGVDAVGYASNVRTYANQIEYSVREVAARVSDFGKIITRQNATYLSEPVSLEQSGDVTTW